jgi:DNA-binding HxlR family transcriptional regulator
MVTPGSIGRGLDATGVIAPWGRCDDVLIGTRSHAGSLTRLVAVSTPRPGQPARGTRTGRPLTVVFDLLGRRWALRVLWELREERLGFRALQARCDDMSSSVLRDRLRELVDSAIVDVDDDGRYGLSDDGRELLRALEPLSDWARQWGARAGR